MELLSTDKYFKNMPNKYYIHGSYRSPAQRISKSSLHRFYEEMGGSIMCVFWNGKYFAVKITKNEFVLRFFTY
jgi:hypothetical protein